MFRIAFIGCGGIANAHARILKELPNVQLTAFCDLVKERAAQFKEIYGEGKGHVYTDFRKMYDRERVDVVYICLPPFAHTDEVERAAEQGVHVFIEKPIALDMDTANRMVAAVEQHKIKAQVGFLFRFGDAIEVVKEMIASGKAGEPGLFMGRYFCNSLHSPWWRDQSKSGGQVVEQIVHTFDIARYLMGDVASVYCAMDNRFHQDVADYTVEDVSATVLRFRNGAVGTVSGTNGAIPGKWLSDYKVVTRYITVYFDDANNAILHHTDSTSGKTTTIHSEKSVMEVETLDLLQAIEEDREPRTPMREGAETLRLVLAIAKSGETGEVVRL